MWSSKVLYLISTEAASYGLLTYNITLRGRGECVCLRVSVRVWMHVSGDDEPNGIGRFVYTYTRDR